VAFDLKTGKFLWSQQFLPNDAWNVACDSNDEKQLPEKRKDRTSISPLRQSCRNYQMANEYSSLGKSPAWCILDPDARGNCSGKNVLGRAASLAVCQWAPPPITNSCTWLCLILA